MPWTNRVSPLDFTVATLDELSTRIRRQLMTDELPAATEFLAVAIVIEHLSKELKPLQDLQIQEQR